MRDESQTYEERAQELKEAPGEGSGQQEETQSEESVPEQSTPADK